MKDDRTICIHGYQDNHKHHAQEEKEVNPPFYPVSAYNYLHKVVIYPSSYLPTLPKYA